MQSQLFYDKDQVYSSRELTKFEEEEVGSVQEQYHGEEMVERGNVLARSRLEQSTGLSHHSHGILSLEKVISTKVKNNSGHT